MLLLLLLLLENLLSYDVLAFDCKCSEGCCCHTLGMDDVDAIPVFVYVFAVLTLSSFDGCNVYPPNAVMKALGPRFVRNCWS